MSPFGGFRGRVLGHGLVLMLLMAAFVIVGDRLFVNTWVEHEIQRRRPLVNSAISIYDASGALVASDVQPAVGPLSSDVVARLASAAEPITVGGAVMSGVFRDGVFAGVVARRLPPPLQAYPGPPLSLLLLALGVCVAATLLASIPLSRAVVQPVETLARSVKRFGSGELGARAALSRRDEIGELAHAFDDMAARIQSLLRTERRLLADVSHELRTPLARIRVILELAADGDPASVRPYLLEIAQDLAELEGLVDDVLASARIAMAADRLGQASLPMHWTNAGIASVVEKSRARFERLHPKRSLETRIDADAGDMACDPTLLRRAVDNLLDNAAKHAPGAHVTLRVAQDADEVSIEVADEGPGMSAEAAARAFEPFFREDASRDRRTGGFGLGLSIVRTIAEAHGGRVTLESKPGVETRVTIRIPRRGDPPGA